MDVKTNKMIKLILILAILPWSTFGDESETPAGDRVWPDKIGPFVIGTKDGNFELRFGLAAQLQTRVDFLDQGSDEDYRTVDNMEIRRMRPTVRGSFLQNHIGFYLHLSTAPGSLEFMDYYLDFRFSPNVRLRTGQWKIPFTRYRIQSFQNLTFVDWALVTKYFGAERQMGFCLHNGTENPEKWQYELGVFTGGNARAAHAVGLPGTVYRVTIENPSDLADSGPKQSFHPELVAHFAYNSGGINVSSDTDMNRGPFRFMAGLSGTWDFEPVYTEDLTGRLAAEFLLKAHGFSFFTVGYAGFVEDMDGDLLPGMTGGLMQGSWLFTERCEVALRYAQTYFDRELREDAGFRADRLIAAAADQDERAALTAQYAKAGTVVREHEATLSFNVYIIGRHLKCQNDFSWVRTVLTDADKDDFRYRLQLQLSF
jgi:hypothetical protein